MHSKLPRGYISWSQYSLFLRSPAEYKRIYIDGGKGFESDYMDFGRKFAEALEGNKSDRQDIEIMKELLPSYPKRELKIEAEFKGIKLLGVLDGWDPRKRIIGEYKTGKKWTQAMVNRHDQLLFYALCVWLKYKKVPKVRLHWVETSRDNYGNLMLTGMFKNFKRDIRLSDLLLFANKIERVVKGISKL